MFTESKCLINLMCCQSHKNGSRTDKKYRKRVRADFTKKNTILLNLHFNSIVIQNVLTNLVSIYEGKSFLIRVLLFSVIFKLFHRMLNTLKHLFSILET